MRNPENRRFYPQALIGMLLPLLPIGLILIAVWLVYFGHISIPNVDLYATSSTMLVWAGGLFALLEYAVLLPCAFARANSGTQRFGRGLWIGLLIVFVLALGVIGSLAFLVIILSLADSRSSSDTADAVSMLMYLVAGFIITILPLVIAPIVMRTRTKRAQMASQAV